VDRESFKGLSAVRGRGEAAVPLGQADSDRGAERAAAAVADNCKEQ